MADETIAFVETLGRRVHLVGHSDGGNIALLVGQRRPDLVRRMVVIGANYHYDGLRDFPLMSADTPEFEEWAVKFAERSPDGVTHARAVLDKTNLLFTTGPTMSVEDLASIAVPTLVMAGDDDVATLAHTTTLYESIPEAQLSILPGASHALLKERPKESVRIIRRFLSQELPIVTYSPLRRANVSDFPGD
jgi:pimeloyl-ACP methyl ester carboxylesterase